MFKRFNILLLVIVMMITAISIAGGSGVAYAETVEPSVNYANTSTIATKDDLRTKMFEAEQINASLYTQDSLLVLQRAYENARAVYDDPMAAPSRVDEIYDRLVYAMSHLYTKNNYTSLKKLLDTTLKVDKKRFSRPGIEKLERVYDMALKCYRDQKSTQSTIDSYVDLLSDALYHLAPAGNYEQYQEKLEQLDRPIVGLYYKSGIEKYLTYYNKMLKNIYNRETEKVLREDWNALIDCSESLIINKNKQELYDALKKAEKKNIAEMKGTNGKDCADIYNDALVVFNDLSANEDTIEHTIKEVKTIGYLRPYDRDGSLSDWLHITYLAITIACLIIASIYFVKVLSMDGDDWIIWGIFFIIAIGAFLLLVAYCKVWWLIMVIEQILIAAMMFIATLMFA